MDQFHISEFLLTGIVLLAVIAVVVVVVDVAVTKPTVIVETKLYYHPSSFAVVLFYSNEFVRNQMNYNCFIWFGIL